MKENKLMPVHPGEVLLEEFLKPMNLSQNQLALGLKLPTQQINEIIDGKQSITADSALRLARYFNMSPRFWLGLQMDYDLDLAEDALGRSLDKRGHSSKP
ncbi:MAG: HigA family addiction module antidote protein [Chloroflexaceae bacterium]|nr:HigA family addiction module antidote protein [Chloroflexaceae bacterium]